MKDPFEKEKSTDTRNFINNVLGSTRHNLPTESKLFKADERKKFLGGLIEKHCGPKLEKVEFERFINKVKNGEIKEINELGEAEKSRILRYFTVDKPPAA